MPLLVFHPKNMMKSVQAKPKYLFYVLDDALLAVEFAHLHQCSAVQCSAVQCSVVPCTGVHCSALVCPEVRAPVCLKQPLGQPNLCMLP